jgi:hypothetical protein
MASADLKIQIGSVGEEESIPLLLLMTAARLFRWD